MYPDSSAIKIMFFCSQWDDKVPAASTMYGLRLMAGLGVRIYALHGDETAVDLIKKFGITAFKSQDEAIESKNAVRGKKGNQSVKIWRDETGAIRISAKLDKGEKGYKGKVSNDPNVGLVCGIVHNLERLALTPGKYILEDHNVTQGFLNNMRGNKLFRSIHGIDFELEGRHFERPELPERYFIIKRKLDDEKVASVIFDQNSQFDTIFSNHAACALTDIKGSGNKTMRVGQKMKRPDLVLADHNRREVIIVEGKIEKDIMKGIEQLSREHLEGFIGKIVEAWPGYAIRRGLCITIDNIDNIGKYSELKFPVMFALDANGYFIQNL